MVRHGYGRSRKIATGIDPVENTKLKIRDRGASGVDERIRSSSAILPLWTRRAKSLNALIPVLYPPSDVPEQPERYSQEISRDDVLALMTALSVEKAHVVGHSMGAYTALHVGLTYPERCMSITAAGCGWGSTPDSAQREAMKAMAAETGKMFAEEGIQSAAAKFADTPMRQTHKHKDPRGWAEFARMLSEHSAIGHALTMFNLQVKRPTLWEMEDKLKTFSVPLLVVVGDEDFPCLDGSLFLKRTVPTAGLLVVPRSGHTITSEEPAIFNAALTGRQIPLFFVCLVERG